MKKDKYQVESRRDFLKDVMRAGLLTGFALTGLFLGSRSQKDGQNGQACSASLPCRSCSLLRGCQEPKALKTKQEGIPSAERAKGGRGG